MSSVIARQSSDCVCEVLDGRIEAMRFGQSLRRTRKGGGEGVLSQGRSDRFWKFL